MSSPFTSDDNWLLSHTSLDASPNLRDPHGLFGSPTHNTGRRRAIATSVEDLFRAPLPAAAEAEAAAALRAREAEEAVRLETQRRVQYEMAMLMQQSAGGRGMGRDGGSGEDRGEVKPGSWGSEEHRRVGRRDSRDSAPRGE